MSEVKSPSPSDGFVLIGDELERLKTELVPKNSEAMIELAKTLINDRLSKFAAELYDKTSDKLTTELGKDLSDFIRNSFDKLKEVHMSDLKHLFEEKISELKLAFQSELLKLHDQFKEHKQKLDVEHKALCDKQAELIASLPKVPLVRQNAMIDPVEVATKVIQGPVEVVSTVGSELEDIKKKASEQISHWISSLPFIQEDATTKQKFDQFIKQQNELLDIIKQKQSELKKKDDVKKPLQGSSPQPKLEQQKKPVSELKIEISKPQTEVNVPKYLTSNDVYNMIQKTEQQKALANMTSTQRMFYEMQYTK